MALLIQPMLAGAFMKINACYPTSSGDFRQRPWVLTQLKDSKVWCTNDKVNLHELARILTRVLKVSPKEEVNQTVRT